jgi:hypothetical protein
MPRKKRAPAGLPSAGALSAETYGYLVESSRERQGAAHSGQ